MPKISPTSPAPKTARKVETNASALEKRVRAIGRQIQKDYGVTVLGKQRQAPNPYDMSTDEAVILMKKAGILTKAGNLSPSYK